MPKHFKLFFLNIYHYHSYLQNKEYYTLNKKKEKNEKSNGNRAKPKKEVISS